MKVKIAHSRMALRDHMDYTVHRSIQGRILEWVAFPFSRGSSQPRDQTQVSSLQADSLPDEPQGNPIIDVVKFISVGLFCQYIYNYILVTVT